MNINQIFFIIIVGMLLITTTNCKKKWEPEVLHQPGVPAVMFIAERCDQIPNASADYLIEINVSIFICPSFNKGDMTCNIIWIRCWGEQFDPAEWKRRPHQNPR